MGRSASCTGTGLHTGVESTVTFKPAAENSGIRFMRTDLEEYPEVRAHIDHVIDVSRGTSLEADGVKIHTVEHVLAAIMGLEIDNVLIELTNKEPPIMDGSCRDFVQAIQEAGIVSQKEPRRYLEVEKPISYYDEKNGVDIGLLPSDHFRITCIIDYKHPALGTQYLTVHSLEDFAGEIAPARTFCFLSEVEKLREDGLARGGNLGNTIVIADKEIGEKEIRYLQTLFDVKEDIVQGSSGILNGVKLRFENEAVRHKALDLIGDLALLGKPIKGHVMAARSGHASHTAFVKKISEEYMSKPLREQYRSPQTSKYHLDISAISKIMPHRYPFLLVDRILELKAGKSLVAIKNVTINEPFFQGHFPHRPLMPGVLILEGMAQAGGFLVLHTTEDPESKFIYFASIEKARFRHPVSPGDQLRFEMKLLKFRMNSIKIEGKAYVEDKLVAEAIFLATIADREKD